MKIHGNGVNICVFFVHFTDHQSVIYVACPRSGHPQKLGLVNFRIVLFTIICLFTLFAYFTSKVLGRGVNICVFFVPFTDHQSVIFVAFSCSGDVQLHQFQTFLFTIVSSLT